MSDNNFRQRPLLCIMSIKTSLLEYSNRMPTSCTQCCSEHKGCQKVLLKMLHRPTGEAIVVGKEKSHLQLTVGALSVMKHSSMVELN